MAEAAGSVRFTLGSETTEDEIEAVITTLPEIVSRLRGAAPALTVPS
jgi:cysteine sulfinate desulfinase/cysteine desulfurase-like protein